MSLPGNSNPFVLPMAAVAALALIFISESSYWQSSDALLQLRNIQQLGAQSEQLEQALTSAETHERAFRLSALPADLLPYAAARRGSVEAMDGLAQTLRKDKAAAPRLAELRALTQRRLLDLDSAIARRRAGRDDDPTSTDPGPADMARLRALTRIMLDEQTADRDSTNRSLSRTLLLNRLGVALLSVVLLAALMLYLRKSDGLARTLAAQQRLVKAAHDRLEVQVAQRTAELTDLTRHLLIAREDERNRLARNLHDDLGSLLTAAKLDAARVKSRLGTAQPEAHQRLADLVDKLNGGIALGRAIIEDLRPSTLSHLGLATTLTILLREFAERSGVQVHTDLQLVQLTPSAELVIFRVVQEAVTNLSKYANASQVWLTLGPAPDRPGWVAVTVRDNGDGFDADAPTRSAYGLLGMRFRAEAEGGSLQMRSQPGQGTLVSVWLPARPDGSAATEAPCATAADT